jgi:hypothetical protein
MRGVVLSTQKALRFVNEVHRRFLLAHDEKYRLRCYCEFTVRVFAKMHGLGKPASSRMQRGDHANDTSGRALGRDW